MNNLLAGLVKVLKVKFKRTCTKYNYYDGENEKGERIIYINEFNDLLVPAKLLWGRPTDAYFTESHEVGHAFFDAMDLSDDNGARRLFGDFSQEYRDEFGLLASIFHQPTGEYATKYASEHPLEDFADCFAFMVINHNFIPVWATNKKLRRKFEFIQKRIAKLNLI